MEDLCGDACSFSYRALPTMHFILMTRKATVSLHREEWERLVMEQIREYTDKLLATEDFSLACRFASAHRHAVP